MSGLGILGRLGAIGLLSLLAAACTPSLEAQVFAVQSGYTAAMVPAADYVEQPACDTARALPAPLCSDPIVVDRIQDAVAIAGPAVRAAQAEARRGGNRTTVQAFLDTARAALAALIAATPTKEPPA